MKIWTGFGSEHSYNLILIGHFADERNARAVEEKFAQLQDLANKESDAVTWDDDDATYSPELYNSLRELNVWNLSRSDVDGFGYLGSLERNGARVTLRTDDAELQGLLKLLFDHGARVEIYSAHHWTDDGEPREPESLEDGETGTAAADEEANLDATEASPSEGNGASEA
jgi:hypothetical protein